MPGRLLSNATSPAQGSTNATEPNNAAANRSNSVPPAGPPPSHPLPSTPPIDIPHGRRPAQNHDTASAAHVLAQASDRHDVDGVSRTYVGAVFSMTFQPSTPVVTANAPHAPVQQQMVNGVGATHAPTLDSIPSQPVTPQSSPPQGHAGSSAPTSFPTSIRSGSSYEATTGRATQAAATAPSVLPPIQRSRREQGSGGTGSTTRTEGNASERSGSRQ